MTISSSGSQGRRPPANGAAQPEGDAELRLQERRPRAAHVQLVGPEPAVAVLAGQLPFGEALRLRSRQLLRA